MSRLNKALSFAVSFYPFFKEMKMTKYQSQSKFLLKELFTSWSNKCLACLIKIK